jgi:hypothetical protein
MRGRMAGMIERLVAIGGEYTTSAPHFRGSLGAFLTILLGLGVIIAIVWILLTNSDNGRKK